jgi:hypothetical protein
MKTVLILAAAMLVSGVTLHSAMARPCAKYERDEQGKKQCVEYVGEYKGGAHPQSPKPPKNPSKTQGGR